MSPPAAGSPPRPLITVEELRPLVERAAVTLLDVRWSVSEGTQREAYRAGHLPGAHLVDLDTELAAPPGEGGRHPLPSPAVFEQAMRRCGVRAGFPVVVYDAATATSAARAWWLLRWFGHGDVRVLDGGYAAWEEAGGPIEQAEPPTGSGDFVAEPGGMPVVTAEDAAHLAHRGALIDARAPERYRGEHEPVDPVAGHIPGAVNVPTSANVDESGRFLTPESLRARLAAAVGHGAHRSSPVGAYCGSGVTAAHTVLALQLAGIQAALYPGSWSEWIRDPERQVATGPDPDAGTPNPTNL